MKWFHILPSLFLLTGVSFAAPKETAHTANTAKKESVNTKEQKKRLTHDEAVAALEKRGIDVSNMSERLIGNYLYQNVEADRKDVVSLLLIAGADPNAEKSDFGSEGDSPLFVASPACMKLLLGAGADIRKRNSNGDTALMAVSHPLSAKLLLAAGAELEAQDEEGYTPLLKAALCGNAPVVRVLAAAGANVKAANKEGKTALMLAAENGHIVLVKQLLAHGFGSEAELKKALNLAQGKEKNPCVKPLQEALSGKSWQKAAPEITDELLPDAQKPDEAVAALIKGWFLAEGEEVQLDEAELYIDQAKILRLYLLAYRQQHTDLAKQGKLLGYLLVRACEKGYAAAANLLLDSGADPTVKDFLHRDLRQHFTAMDYACSYGYPKCLKALLDAGAVPGGSALQYAAGAGHVECVKLLVQTGMDKKALSGALFYCCNSEGIYEGGENSLTFGRRTAAQEAACIRILVKAGAEVNEEAGDMTPLLCAVRRESETAVRELLKAGANPPLQNSQWKSTLSGCKSKEIISMLKVAGAK